MADGCRRAVGAIGWVVTVSINVGFLLLALKFLRVGYELGDATDRRRMLWIVEGIAASAAIEAVAAAAVFVLAGEVPPTVIENAPAANCSNRFVVDLDASVGRDARLRAGLHAVHR